ncbi:MAG: short-chain dehydrogenase [Crocinitomicaceae bacterium]|nr:short-chain dehydrogenase [Crocinitomicaceae bacterium]|tara:strand:+ start:2491 stop:3201 length:711 start_codon:yes stop_codon:yes gene_type:complete
MDLKGSKILITGGSSGIGKAIAALAVSKGAQVLITGKDPEKLKRVATELGAEYLAADVSSKEDIRATYDWIKEKWNNELDVLINNAGTGYRKMLNEVEWEDFENIFQVNVYGAALMAKHAAEIFKNRGKGNIVNIASTGGVKGYPTGTVYAASKFALRGMTQCWQAELRPHNIRVILINPSEVTTAFANPDRVERESIANKLTPQEIAHATISALEMDDRGFIPELTVWASNPFQN